MQRCPVRDRLNCVESRRSRVDPGDNRNNHCYTFGTVCTSNAMTPGLYLTQITLKRSNIFAGHLSVIWVNLVKGSQCYGNTGTCLKDEFRVPLQTAAKVSVLSAALGCSVTCRTRIRDVNLIPF